MAADRAVSRAPREGVQPGRDVTQRGRAGGQLVELGHGPGGGRAAVADRAGHPALQHAVALQHLDQQAAVLQQRLQRARVEPAAQRVVRAEAAVRVGEQGPGLGEATGERARRAPRRTGPATSTDTAARCRWPRPARPTARAGSSTTSSRPCPSTRSAAAGRDDLGRARPRRPGPRVTRSCTPASRARRCSAASAFGLGSTTVTAQPSPASGTAHAPLPPPTSSTCGGAPGRAWRSRATSAASARCTGRRRPRRPLTVPLSCLAADVAVTSRDASVRGGSRRGGVTRVG